MKDKRIYAFPPVVSESSKILILGSMPGRESLIRNEYYANSQNKFWQLMFDIFETRMSQSYEEKVNLLKQNNMALWDVLESCEREGSLDSNIKYEKVNPIKEFLKDYPNIKAIFCNGQKSHKNLIKIVGKNYHIPIFILPSTSPAHTIPYDKKLEEWSIILKYLD